MVLKSGNTDTDTAALYAQLIQREDEVCGTVGYGLCTLWEVNAKNLIAEFSQDIPGLTYWGE